MNKKGLKLFFLILFMSISIYNLLNYIEYSNVIRGKGAIKYVIADMYVKKGGRGNEYHRLQIFYEGNEFMVEINREKYIDIKKGILPTLYFSKKKHVVFSEWEETLAIRISTLFFILGLLCAGLLVFKTGNVRKQWMGKSSSMK